MVGNPLPRVPTNLTLSRSIFFLYFFICLFINFGDSESIRRQDQNHQQDMRIYSLLSNIFSLVPL